MLCGLHKNMKKITGQESQEMISAGWKQKTNIYVRVCSHWYDKFIFKTQSMRISPNSSTSVEKINGFLLFLLICMNKLFNICNHQSTTTALRLFPLPDWSTYTSGYILAQLNVRCNSHRCINSTVELDLPKVSLMNTIDNICVLRQSTHNVLCATTGKQMHI